MFYVLAKVNSMAVTALSSFASEMGATLAMTNSSFGTGFNAMIQFVLDLLLFFINAGLIIKINLDYFIRSITIMILHAMAPVAIASISFDNRKTIFNSWLKELVGTIFMQSFNALVLAMIMIVLKGGAVHWWYYQASLFAISSLNSWFMKIFGLQNSVADISGRVYDQSKNAAREAKKNIGTIAALASVGMGAAAAGGGSAAMAGGNSAPGAVASAMGESGGGASAGGGQQGGFSTNVAKNTGESKKADGVWGQKPQGLENKKFNFESNGNASAKVTVSKDSNDDNSTEQISSGEGSFSGQTANNSGNETTDKSGTISSEGNDMSFKDKVVTGGKKALNKAWNTAKFAGAVTAAVTAENDIIRQGAREYLGYEKGMDKDGKEGYFGYQPFGTANSAISKENQQRQREAGEAKRRQEEQQQQRDQEQQQRDQEEQKRKIDEMYDYFAEEREQAEGAEGLK